VIQLGKERRGGKGSRGEGDGPHRQGVFLGTDRNTKINLERKREEFTPISGSGCGQRRREALRGGGEVKREGKGRVEVGGPLGETKTCLKGGRKSPGGVKVSANLVEQSGG